VSPPAALVIETTAIVLGMTRPAGDEEMSHFNFDLPTSIKGERCSRSDRGLYNADSVGRVSSWQRMMSRETSLARSHEGLMSPFQLREIAPLVEGTGRTVYRDSISIPATHVGLRSTNVPFFG
jgi:hypothetical protein